MSAGFNKLSVHAPFDSRLALSNAADTASGKVLLQCRRSSWTPSHDQLASEVQAAPPPVPVPVRHVAQIQSVRTNRLIRRRFNPQVPRYHAFQNDTVPRIGIHD